MESKSVAEAARRERVVASVRAERPISQGRWWKDAQRRRMLACADLLSGLLATAAVAVPAVGSAWPLIFVPLWPLLAKIFGLYDRDHRALRHLTADETIVLFAWSGTLTMLVALVLPITPAESMGGYSIIGLFLVSAVLAVTLRTFARWAWWRATPPELVGLIGDPPVIESLRRKVDMFREMHLELESEVLISDLDSGRPREEELNSLATGVDRIVVAANGAETELIGQLKDICRRRQVKLSVVSPLRGNALPSDRFAQLADLPILEYNTWDASRSTLVMKRIFDLVVSAIGLLLFLPIFVVIAILIKLDTPGPIFFTQIRAGLHGRPFRIYKLRTMVVDAEERLPELINLDELDEPVFKLRDDPRVTRVGRFLRRFSLDEVPQLLNVLAGEMSMVGPRPEQTELVDRYADEERVKLTVKPGVTGPMQVFGRGELTFGERLAIESEYVENQSLARDIRILLHTPSAIMRGTGAY